MIGGTAAVHMGLSWPEVTQSLPSQCNVRMRLDFSYRALHTLENTRRNRSHRWRVRFIAVHRLYFMGHRETTRDGANMWR